MTQMVCVILNESGEAQLADIVGSRSRPLKHIQCAGSCSRTG